MYAACAYKRGAKVYNNNKKFHNAHPSFYRDETRANTISCYTSAAKSTGCGSARPTIICFYENRRFNTHKHNNYYYYGASLFSSVRGPQAVRGSNPTGGRFRQLTKVHCISQTRNPALCREGHFHIRGVPSAVH